MVRMLNMISDNVQALLAISPAKVSYMIETFKERMKRISARAGFKSQKAAADAIGCDRGNVGTWEAPSSPVQSVGQDWLFPVARTYKVRPEWLNDLISDDDGYPWQPTEGQRVADLVERRQSGDPSRPSRRECERKLYGIPLAKLFLLNVLTF